MGKEELFSTFIRYTPVYLVVNKEHQQFSVIRIDYPFSTFGNSGICFQCHYRRTMPPWNLKNIRQCYNYINTYLSIRSSLISDKLFISPDISLISAIETILTSPIHSDPTDNTLVISWTRLISILILQLLWQNRKKESVRNKLIAFAPDYPNR